MKCVLVITDGIGYSPKTRHNAFYHAKKPSYEWLFENVPYSMIDTFGLSVGLPQGQMGNSEVGHMCLGAGRILYQDLVKISKAIESSEIAKLAPLEAIRQECEVVHIAGLLSDGGVHSHISHIIALATLYEGWGKRVYLHLITDGRDVLPQSALGYIEQIEAICSDSVKIASVSGRFYAMDRDKRWERIKLAYDVLTSGANRVEMSVRDYIAAQYERGIFDEFIEPACFGEYGGMASSESISESRLDSRVDSENATDSEAPHKNMPEGFIFANFRSDRAREIIEALGSAEFSGFRRERIARLHIATMCEYDASFPYPILFPKEKVANTLSEVISRAGLSQLHTAETEKYAHVTFFFNGGREAAFDGEERVLIPSPDVKTHDLQPQMSAPEVGEAVCEGIKKGYDFIVVNFANGDMVGHTGDFDAAVRAVEAVDRELGKIIESARVHNYALFITSDHGNCEEMKDEAGNTLTNHTIGQVWCFGMVEGVGHLDNGGLNNIAPSILKAMGLEIPSEMDRALF